MIHADQRAFALLLFSAFSAILKRATRYLEHVCHNNSDINLFMFCRQISQLLRSLRYKAKRVSPSLALRRHFGLRLFDQRTFTPPTPDINHLAATSEPKVNPKGLVNSSVSSLRSSSAGTSLQGEVSLTKTKSTEYVPVRQVTTASNLALTAVGANTSQISDFIAFDSARTWLLRPSQRRHLECS